MAKRRLIPIGVVGVALWLVRLVGVLRVGVFPYIQRSRTRANARAAPRSKRHLCRPQFRRAMSAEPLVNSDLLNGLTRFTLPVGNFEFRDMTFVFGASLKIRFNQLIARVT